MNYNLESKNIGGEKIRIIRHETIIIGTGCAGYNAADSLYNFGHKDIAIVTEGINMGTSRNTGSDKQTYYKLSICGDSSDSVNELAENLFGGGSVHGDIALAEAAGSVRSFMKLVNLGVPFPTNIYGEYVGYKTDHDPKQRATSCGPLTSKIMTEKLQAEVEKKNIQIYDGLQIIKILTENNSITGLIALNANCTDNCELVLILCSNVIMATGGPAIAYYSSVYPLSQTGMTGTALSAGAKACNLNEWQYGLASTKFRWNVSGSYQQVLPRYIAVDKDGNKREFLPEYFKDAKTALDMVFLKGYQWPFDSAKVSASSIIDIIVHNETANKGNRVYMDFTTDPQGLESGFESLSGETYDYLKNSDILIKTPIERLKVMNPKAIELYRNNGIDIEKEMLEVAVCAQHCNGGIAVDANWQSSVNGLYVVGEAAGTFGTARPGGSALNSTQVGSLRAAEHIAFSTKKALNNDISNSIENDVACVINQINSILNGGEKAVLDIREDFQKKMSKFSAHIRNTAEFDNISNEISCALKEFSNLSKSSFIDLAQVYKNLDMLNVQLCMLSAMKLSAAECNSRGGSIVTSVSGERFGLDKINSEDILDYYKYLIGNNLKRDFVIETSLSENNAKSEFVAVRHMPKTDQWFENVWNDFEKRRKTQ